jgi:hypothetical protein
VEADGDLVAHGSGGNEKGGFAAKDFGGAALKLVDGWIFAVDVVAHFGGGHGGTHFWGGAGYGVAAEVD